MRTIAVLAALLALAPLAAAHDDNLLFRLVLPAGASAGPAIFELHGAHRLLGIGVGGCAADAVGALRIATPSGGMIEVTMRSVQGCSGVSTNAVADPTTLPAGTYAGTYAFVVGAPALVEIYGSHV